MGMKIYNPYVYLAIYSDDGSVDRCSTRCESDLNSEARIRAIFPIQYHEVYRYSMYAFDYRLLSLPLYFYNII